MSLWEIELVEKLSAGGFSRVEDIESIYEKSFILLI